MSIVPSRRAMLGLLGAGATSLAGLAQTQAQAQAQPWKPSRPVTIVVPFGAGSGTDAITRILAGLLEPTGGSPSWWKTGPARTARWRPAQVARSAPDGHTLMMTTNTPMPPTRR